MSMKNIKYFLLLFVCLLMAGQIWAGNVITVTKAEKGEKSTTGTLLWAINQINAANDTIKFAEEIANNTIDLESNIIPINKGTNNFVIKGNGIKFSNGIFQIKATSIKLEDLKFESVCAKFMSTKQILFTNCTFNNGYKGMYINYTTVADGGSTFYFEGCFFRAQSSFGYFNFSSNRESKPIFSYFTSCSFYNESITNDKYLFTGTDYVTTLLTNSVVADANDKISNYPITSGKYNVIKGGVYENSTFSHENVDIYGSDIEDPLIIINNIPKVREAGGAYQHFPVREDLTFQEGVNFPEKDIKGTTIDYTQKTHSGACQESTDVTIIPVTGISLNKTKTKFTLSRNEIHDTLKVNPIPDNATFDTSLIGWKSNNENIATIDNKGVITAIAAGKTTITAIYDNNDQITSCCEIEVFEYVTVTSGEASGEGSLDAILPTLQNGDVLSFSDELKGKTITLPEPDYNNPYDKTYTISKSIKILGNGVTLANNYLTIDNSFTGKVSIENMNFVRSGINAYNAKDTVNIRNCKFTDGNFRTASGDKTSINAPYSRVLVAEGCQFLAESQKSTAIFVEWFRDPMNARIHLTSCSLINTINEKDYNSWTSAANIIHVFYYGDSNKKNPPEITLTNCVIQDNPPRSGDSGTPAITAPVIHSNGYNVIKGLIATEILFSSQIEKIDVTNELSSDKNDVVSASMQNPVIKDSDLYKVITGRSAADHLPGNKTILGVYFPEKDLAGNTIDYTNATHSGAIQATAEATEDISDIKFFAINTTLDRGKTMNIEVIRLPENAKNQSITWESSNQNKATVTEGFVNGLLSGQTDTVAIIARYGEKKDSIILTINGTLTNGIALGKEKDTLFISYPKQFTVTVSPENATYQSLLWSSSNKEIATVDSKGNVTPTREGDAVITVKDPDNENISASCSITVKKSDYTTGIFLVNEDWYGHQNGTVNHLSPEGKWLYRIVQQENPGHELGATTQFGAIYGDKFYLVSKQEKDPGATVTGSRLAICNAKTMKLEKEFTETGYGENNGDGRSFTGVNEQKGYVATSNGIYILDLEKLEFIGKIAGAEGDGQGGGNPENDPNLYSGQVGTMLRIGDRVFANHQKKGLLVINPESNQVETILDKYHFTAIVQSKDGYLWAGTTQDISGGPSGNRADKRIIKIDPWTLDMTEIPLSIEGPYANWGAWRADAFCASVQENKLYWRNMPTFFGTEIYEYDIATGSIKTILDLTQYDNGKWRIYETGFRIDPVTNLLYISITAGEPINWGGQYNRTLKLNPATGDVTTYELEDYYWFPAMYVFPDNEAPVVSGIGDKITLDKKELVVDLPVTDADNMDAAIVKTVSSIENPELISAKIIKNQLCLAQLKEPEEEAKTSTVTLKFNSNGKVVEKMITVKVAKPTLGNSIAISPKSTTLTVGETSQLEATILPENATYKEVVWKSSDNTIVSITEDGQIKALKAGTATITAESVQDNLKAECTVTVIKRFELDKQSLGLYVNQQAELTTNAEAGQPVEWSTSDESVVAVDNGRITALKSGSATITAQNKTTGQSSYCEVTVREAVLELDKQSLELYVNQMAQLTAKTEAGLPIEWTTSDASVATVNNGQVIALKAGSTTITAQNKTIGKSVSCKVTVRETDILPDVDVEETSAYIIFPRLEEASYYLVYVYKRANGLQTLAFTLKVGSDGSILRSTKAEAGDINIYLPNLETSTEYITVVEAMRTKPNGEDEVIQVLTAPSFTTGNYPTGNEQMSAQKPEVYYHNNALLLKGMEGYTCYLVTLNGQMREVFEVGSSEEIHRISLSAGVYLLTGTNGEKNVTFKFIAK